MDLKMVSRETSISILLMISTLLLNSCLPAEPTNIPVQPTQTKIPPTITLPPPTDMPTVTPTEEIIELGPSPRGYVSMAYDSESKQVILFGGQTGDFRDPANYSNETWAFDVTTHEWINMKPDSAPPAGSAGSLAYDIESDRIILFGSVRGLSPSGDLWAYDYNSNTWTKLPAKGPINRLGIRMAYDSESDRIILFGGYNAALDKMYQDTWAYDHNSDTWTKMKPSVSPPGQNFHSMTYNSKADRVILWGGDTETVAAKPPKDPNVWAYDFNTDTWEQMVTSEGPSARAYSTIAYNAAADIMIMYGGYSAGSNSMWAYDYNMNNWAFLTPNVDPGQLSRHAFAYVPDLDRFILFGGQVGSDQYAYTQATWLYDLNTNTWNEVRPH